MLCVSVVYTHSDCFLCKWLSMQIASWLGTGHCFLGPISGLGPHLAMTCASMLPQFPWCLPSPLALIVFPLPDSSLSPGGSGLMVPSHLRLSVGTWCLSDIWPVLLPTLAICLLHHSLQCPDSAEVSETLGYSEKDITLPGVTRPSHSDLGALERLLASTPASAEWAGIPQEDARAHAP